MQRQKAAEGLVSLGSMSDFTDKQQRFIEEYTVDFNATQAAIRAGYSEKTAGSIGSENLQKPEIAEAISHRVEQLAMSADEALIRLGQMARGTLAPFHRLDADGNIVVDLSTKEARDHLHLLTEMDVSSWKDEKEDGSVSMRQSAKLKIHDAKDALKQIVRVHGLFVDRTEVTGRDGGPIQVEDLSDDELQERAAQLTNRVAAFIPSTNGDGD